MRRDHLFGQEIVRQAQAIGYETVSVNGRLSIDEQTDQIAAYFKLL